MPVDETHHESWTRKHDMPGSPYIPKATRILYPKSLEELIDICSNLGKDEEIKAAGSHWALSAAALSDDLIFVETNDPNNVLPPADRTPPDRKVFPAMGRTLYDVIPDCMNEDLLKKMAETNPKAFGSVDAPENEGNYFVHFETGKRVFQLYAELDHGDDDNKRSLARYLAKRENTDYLGPWAFQTLGGAGGQTVFGALTTGTHGGDIKFPPIADSVVAIHLVADGGRHYWIEPGTPTQNTHKLQLTDDKKLKSLYGNDLYRGKEMNGVKNFEIIRDDDIFNSVLISAGRFGIVYSVIMRAVRQYCLHEECRLNDWQDIIEDIKNTGSYLYEKRFLQVGICLTPRANFKKNRCGITRRWNVATAGSDDKPNGRADRRGEIIEDYNIEIRGPRFDKAGNSFTYNPDPAKPNVNRSPGFLDSACSYSHILEGAFETIILDIKIFVTYGYATIGGPIAAVFAPGAGVIKDNFLEALKSILDWLFGFRIKTKHHESLGQNMEEVKNYLLDPSAPPIFRKAGLLVWQALANLIFESMQENRDFEAISYAVMDRHNYFDKSCQVNVDSIEVFFDATDPMLIVFIDNLIDFETEQEKRGKAFVGYASLRYTGKTSALIGMEKYPITCAVEIAGLKDVSGSVDLIDFAIKVSLNKTYKGILHWGQRNNSNESPFETKMSDIEFRFGDGPEEPWGYLRVWRNALSRITANGRLDGFSSQFTRQMGLEIVTPIIQIFKAEPPSILLGQSVLIWWNCEDNPSQTKISLEVLSPSDTRTVFDSLPLSGKRALDTTERGIYRIILAARIELIGEKRRPTSEIVMVTVT